MESDLNWAMTFEGATTLGRMTFITMTKISMLGKLISIYILVFECHSDDFHAAQQDVK